MTFSARTLITAAACSLLLAACQSKSPPPSAPSRAALPTMERVGIAAYQCWFKAKDPSFAAYHMAPELNSYSGKPRILLVKANSPETRPLLVIQAEGNPARLDIFGPLMNEGVSARINKDVYRWAAGAKGC